ncbi:dienelactone hydrolase [Phragmitibacter flavus]|uniref:Dienelactone hydrolase n=1 Tax=Phragmitibacter flavus TaxID=2576071 RepID=A0A5R8KK22_9BACT|nr:dienelactone hydrolase [Phragmitibacter flavus]TLD72673.1 dienelactone hydrolase [Phragmitibacter flavus]
MMKSALFPLIWLVTTVIHAAEPTLYDPSKRGAAPVIYDRDFATTGGERVVPTRIFLPAGSGPAAVILVSHGLGGSREGSNFLGEHWSARGYVTVFLQHPGSDESVWRGKPVIEARREMKRAANAANYLLRIADVRTVLDGLEKASTQSGDRLAGRLDLKRVGMSGHSFGAKTTQALGGEQQVGLGGARSAADSRIKAALPMSPSPAAMGDPSDSFGAVKIPWMLMTGTDDGAPSGVVSTTPEDRRKVYPALPMGDHYELVLYGAEHSVFTERRLPAERNPRNPNHHRAILAISTAFWDAHLMGNAAALEWLRKEARSVLESADVFQVKKADADQTRAPK